MNFSDPIHHTPHLQHGQPRMIDRSNGHAYHRRVTIADADRIDRLRTRMSDLDPLASPKAVFIREPNQSGRSLILDASFNPPTLAHRALAESAAEAANASSILLQLSVANVDKTVTSADLGQRLFMLELMAQGHDHVGITGCSHARFIDKAVAIRELSPGLHPIFAIGYDTLVRLFDEKYYEDMMGDLEAFLQDVDTYGSKKQKTRQKRRLLLYAEDVRNRASVGDDGIHHPDGKRLKPREVDALVKSITNDEMVATADQLRQSRKRITNKTKILSNAYIEVTTSVSVADAIVRERFPEYEGKALKSRIQVADDQEQPKP